MGLDILGKIYYPSCLNTFLFLKMIPPSLVHITFQKGKGPIIKFKNKETNFPNVSRKCNYS